MCVIFKMTLYLKASLVGKESACNAGDLVSIPGLGRSPGEGNRYPFLYFGLENSMDCIVHGITKSRTQRVALTFTFISESLDSEAYRNAAALIDILAFLLLLSVMLFQGSFLEQNCCFRTVEGFVAGKDGVVRGMRGRLNRVMIRRGEICKMRLPGCRPCRRVQILF